MLFFKNLFNLRRIGRAAVYSLHGLRWLVCNEAAFKQELLLFAVMLAVASWFGLPATAMLVQAGLMVFVLVVEALNTGLEKLVDRISKEHHPLSGIVKDIGSAAVAMSFLPLGLFWLWVLWLCRARLYLLLLAWC